MKYIKAMSLDLHLTDYTRMQMVYVLDDVATMEVGDRDLITDEINRNWYTKGDGISGLALQGDRGPSGARGLNRDSGDNVALKGPNWSTW